MVSQSRELPRHTSLATKILNKPPTSSSRLELKMRTQHCNKQCWLHNKMQLELEELLTHNLQLNHNLLLNNSHQQKEENNKTTIIMEPGVTQELAETLEPVQVGTLELVVMPAPVQEVPH